MSSSSDRLQKMAEQLQTIRMRRKNIKDIPTPQIIPIFQSLSSKQRRLKQLEDTKMQITKIKKWIAKNDSDLEREQKAYQQREQMLQDQLLIYKAFMRTLSSAYEETKKSYKELELTKTLISAYRRCYFFRLGEIFLNDSSRGLFRDFGVVNSNNNQKVQTKSVIISQGVQQLSGTSLSYLMLLVFSICKILNIEMLNEYIFKGSRSYILTPDKSQAVMLYKTVGRSMQTATKLCQINLVQVFDVLGISRKARNVLSFRQQMDLLTQILISTDVEEIHKML